MEHVPCVSICIRFIIFKVLACGLPYSGKFSRVAVFADVGSKFFLRYNFRQSALRAGCARLPVRDIDRGH